MQALDSSDPRTAAGTPLRESIPQDSARHRRSSPLWCAGTALVRGTARCRGRLLLLLFSAGEDTSLPPAPVVAFVPLHGHTTPTTLPEPQSANRSPSASTLHPLLHLQRTFEHTYSTLKTSTPCSHHGLLEAGAGLPSPLPLITTTTSPP